LDGFFISNQIIKVLYFLKKFQGSAPIFYFKSGWGSGIKNFIVYFEGGG